MPAAGQLACSKSVHLRYLTTLTLASAGRGFSALRCHHMFRIYNCIAYAHDLRLVGLAALVCVLASFAAINLLRHARKSHGQMRGLWLAVSAISTGFGIWATHFVAMLAFTPGIPSGYNIVLTILSLVAAILLTGAGLAVSLTPNWRHGPWIGGAIVAGGIAAMHYTGMAAFEVAGIILWDPVLVAASIMLGAAIGAVALPVGLHGNNEKWKVGGAVLLTLAICSHHFTAMAAVSIIPDPTVEISQTALPAGWLAVGVAIASFGIIGLALAGVVLDIRDHRRSEREVDRMRDLANASVEGLLVCDGEVIVSVNTSFARLTGLSSANLVGATLESCFPAVPIEPDGRNGIAPSRRLDHPCGVDPAADRFCRTAAPSRRRPRSAGAQERRATHLFPGASRSSHLASQPRPFQCADRPGDRGIDPRQEPRRALSRSRPVQGNQ